MEECRGPSLVSFVHRSTPKRTSRAEPCGWGCRGARGEPGPPAPGSNTALGTFSPCFSPPLRLQQWLMSTWRNEASSGCPRHHREPTLLTTTTKWRWWPATQTPMGTSSCRVGEQPAQPTSTITSALSMVSSSLGFSWHGWNFGIDEWDCPPGGGCWMWSLCPAGTFGCCTIFLA